MSASQVLNAPASYDTLVPNDALQDPNFCNQCKFWKLIALNVLLKAFTQVMDSRKSHFSPNTPDALCAKGTRHLIRSARNGSIQTSLTLDIRNSSTSYSRRIGLEVFAKTRRKLGRFTTVVAFTSVTLKPWLH